jgi:hypothetical protein
MGSFRSATRKKISLISLQAFGEMFHKIDSCNEVLCSFLEGVRKPKLVVSLAGTKPSFAERDDEIAAINKEKS